MGIVQYLNEEVERCCHPQQRQQSQADLEPEPSVTTELHCDFKEANGTPGASDALFENGLFPCMVR